MEGLNRDGARSAKAVIDLKEIAHSVLCGFAVELFPFWR